MSVIYSLMALMQPAIDDNSMIFSWELKFKPTSWDLQSVICGFIYTLKGMVFNQLKFDQKL